MRERLREMCDKTPPLPENKLKNCWMGKVIYTELQNERLMYEISWWCERESVEWAKEAPKATNSLWM